MTISWLGFSCFKIQTKDLIILTDPFSPATGLRGVKSKADIVTISHNHTDHNYVSGLIGEPFIIDRPGEYEVKDVYIIGFPAFHDAKEGKERGSNIIYRYVVEDMVLVHLGDLGHLLTEEIVDSLGDVDILFVSAGSKHALSFDKIPELISQIEPRLVIPMHYDIPGVKKERELSPLNKFCEEMGISSELQLDKLKVRKKDLTSEETEIKILKKQ